VINIGDIVLVRYVPNWEMEDDLIYDKHNVPYFQFGEIMSKWKPPEFYNVKSFESKYNLYNDFSSGGLVMTQAIGEHALAKAIHDNKLNRTLYPEYKPKDGYLIQE
jgi:hypothetical protein